MEFKKGDRVKDGKLFGFIRSVRAGHLEYEMEVVWDEGGKDWYRLDGRRHTDNTTIALEFVSRKKIKVKRNFWQALVQVDGKLYADQDVYATEAKANASWDGDGNTIVGGRWIEFEIYE